MTLFGHALSPAEARWSAGLTVQAYPPPPEPSYDDPASMSLEDLIRTQPMGLRSNRPVSPFREIDTRRFDPPSEYRKARAFGYSTLSLDAPSGDDDSPSLADSVTTTAMVPFTAVDPTTAYRIESERRAFMSGPLLRTRKTAPNAKGYSIRTSGAPFATRVRIERLRGEQVYVFDDAVLTRQHYRALERRYVSWMTSFWKKMPSLEDMERFRRRCRALRLDADRPAIWPDDNAFRETFLDPDLHAPYEESLVEPDEDEALRRFGRPVDLLYPEEIAELVADAEQDLRDAGLPIPVVRHLRGHRNWEQASAAQVHIGEYVGSAADILG